MVGDGVRGAWSHADLRAEPPPVSGPTIAIVPQKTIKESRVKFALSLAHSASTLLRSLAGRGLERFASLAF